LALDAGMDARRSIKLALRSTQNAYYTSQMDAVDGAIERGREFHEALRSTGLFPEDFLSSLETAELSGTHGESLARLANDYRDRAKAAAKVLTLASTFAVLGLGMVIMVALIFQLFFSLIMPMYTDPMNNLP
jgi:type II secretory pathway component PulF